MSKIGIFIDPHVTDRHRCRCDNFLETVIEKMDYIASQNDYVIDVGDLFHTSSNANHIFYKISNKSIQQIKRTLFSKRTLFYLTFNN